MEDHHNRILVFTKNAQVRPPKEIRTREFIQMLKNKKITNNRHDVLESNVAKEKKLKKKLLADVLPEITADQLKVPHLALLEDIPHMTLQSALWNHSLVTVKRVKGQEGSRTLVKREVDILCRLQHPHLAQLLAVCLDPDPDHLCLVMEHFQFASLNHLLHKTQEKMSLSMRIHLLLDIANAMLYIHSLSIIHGFLNSFSVFIDEKFRAKIGNLEFSQKVGDLNHEIACRKIQKNWMAPEQILHEPPDTFSDVYSFGALMWESLARKVPWSWLTGITLKQALCRDRMILPMLEIWPSFIQSIMKKCFSDPAGRPSFLNLHKYLLTTESCVEGLTSEIMDGAFLDWYEFHVGGKQDETHKVRTRTISEINPSLNTSGKPEIYAMRRRSSSQANGRRRSTHLTSGLKDALRIFSNKAQTRREREIEQYGYQTEEKLQLVRDVHRRARNYSRSKWAKEVALTRAIGRDLGTVQRGKWKNDGTATKVSTSMIHGRNSSVLDEDDFDRLLMTSAKYSKKDWSKVRHGMQKLKNSMRGFKEKVKEELSVSGERDLANYDSFPEKGVVKTLFENAGTAKESATLFSSFENETTNKTVSLKRNIQEVHHSKDSVHSPSQSLNKPLKGKREYVRQEKGVLLSAATTTSADERDTPNTREGTEIGGNLKGNTLRNSVNAGTCGSQRKSATPELIEKCRPRTHSAAKAQASPFVEVEHTRETSKVKEFNSNLVGNSLQSNVNAEACGSRRSLVTAELTTKRQPRTRSAAKAEASSSADVTDTCDTSKITVSGSNLKGKILPCSVNAEACGSRRNSVTSELTEKRQLRTHSVTKAEASPSVDVGDTLDTSEITVFRRNLKGDTLHNSVNAEACGSRGNSVTQDFPVKCKPKTHLAAKADLSALEGSRNSGLKLTDLHRETHSKVIPELQCNNNSKIVLDLDLELQGGSCNNVCAKSFRTNSFIIAPTEGRQKIHRTQSHSPRQVRQGFFDISTATSSTKERMKDRKLPQGESYVSSRTDGTQKLSLGKSLQQQVSFKNNKKLLGDIDESGTFNCGKTLSSGSFDKSSTLEVSGVDSARSNISRNSTERTRDEIKKVDKAKDSKSGGARFQLLTERSGVRVLLDEPQRDSASYLTLKLGDRSSFNPITPSGEGVKTLSVSSLENNAVRSLRKLQKVRSNSLGQEPSKGLTMKCNTLMTKGVGGEDSAAGKPKIVNCNQYAISPSALHKHRRKSFTSELNEKLRLRRKRMENKKNSQMQLKMSSRSPSHNLVKPVFTSLES